MTTPTPDATSSLARCVLEPLDAEACVRHLTWLREPGAAAPSDGAGLAWTLAHCDDGVTWGRYDPDAALWRLGHVVAPAVSPPIHRNTLRELRLFGTLGEILIWRTEAGLRGRVLRETDPPADCDNQSDPLRPSAESRIVLGDRVVAECEHGFTQVANRTGATQVIPLEVTATDLEKRPVRLRLRHYYQEQSPTGAVRVAATRLVSLVKGD